jgi:gliding motility-associated-like protein
VAQDTVSVNFYRAPAVFSLGEDEILCTAPARTLAPFADSDGFEFTWQDGSKQPTYKVLNFGVYSVRIENACGSAQDTVKISQFFFHESKVPNVITPNHDLYNERFILEPILLGGSLEIFNRWGEKVYQSSNYQNGFDGQGLASGVYYYTISHECLGDKKGIIHIVY